MSNSATKKTSVNVSVIIPCYKCSETIDRAVKSIWLQTCLPKEVILVEDCSNDESLTIKALKRIESEYPKDWIICIFSDMNAGPGNARNMGWDVATGEYIAFLDADDSWHNQKIEIQYNFMQKNKDIDLCGHKFANIKYQRESRYIYSNFNSRNVTLKDMFISNRFYTRTVMLKKELIPRFDHKMYRAEDFLLWCELISYGYKGVVIDLSLAYEYRSAGQERLSSNILKMEKSELLAYRKLYQKSIISIYQFCFWSTYSFFKFLRRIFKHLLNQSF